MILQYHIISLDNVCDLLPHNLPVFVARIFWPCDFFVELTRKKSQQISLVVCIVLLCDLRLAVLFIQYLIKIFYIFHFFHQMRSCWDVIIFTNGYFTILAHSQTTAMVLITITIKNDTNDITTTAIHSLFDLNNIYCLFTFTICVFFIFCAILSQTTTTMAVEASTTTSMIRSDYNGYNGDKCGLIDIFIFDQFSSNYSGESAVASDSESARQCGGFSDTQDEPQLVTTNSDNIERPSPLGHNKISKEYAKCNNGRAALTIESSFAACDCDECELITVRILDEFLTSGDAAQRHDIVSAIQCVAQLGAIVAATDTMTAKSDNHECQLSTGYDETPISESTAMIMTAKHAKCNGGDEQRHLGILKTFLECLFIENELLFLSINSFCIWQGLSFLAAAIETISSTSQRSQRSKQREVTEMSLVITANAILHDITAPIEAVATCEPCAVMVNVIGVAVK